MQDNLQFFSPVKQNILRFIACLGISKRSFYVKTGISRGTLESKTGITEDTLAKFIAIYPDVSLEWLFTGIEPMLKKVNANDNILSDVNEVTSQLMRKNEELHSRITDLSVQLAVQVNENKHLRETNTQLLAQIDDLKKSCSHGTQRGIEDK
jgi:hypothetical protein